MKFPPASAKASMTAKLSSRLTSEPKKTLPKAMRDGSRDMPGSKWDI
jgi:hypothetical protein